ncbi:hypothetical protein C0J52_26872 [Blattella germanica]|nr:hypothetical protein C0J52_26872 [Blattella germanica]
MKENPALVLVKKCFTDIAPWTTCNIIKKGRRPEDVFTMELKPMECKNRLTVEKKNDLKKIIAYLSNNEHKQFYYSLTQ